MAAVRLLAPLLLAILAWPASARAGGARHVAVLPLVAGDADLRIYSRPVADEVARTLRGKLDVAVETLTDAGGVSENIDLVIDGRITRFENGIGLEARVRDPSAGRAIGSATAKNRPLEQMDRSAIELGGKLAQIIARWERSRPREPYRLKEAVIEAHPPAGHAAGKAERRHPLLVILPARGEAAGGSVPVSRQATHAALAFAERLGVSFVTAPEEKKIDSVSAANAVRAHEARYALTLEIRSVSFDFAGVLSARGRASVKLVDRNGVVVFRQPVATDTVVGSRGDRHTALVYAVAEQALDIAAPKLRKALAP